MNLLQALTSVLSYEGVYISAFLCSERFLQDLTFCFKKIQGIMVAQGTMVAKRSFHIWHEVGDGSWHHEEKMG